MKRVKLTVAYDGTAYHGWQLQPGAVTIESELNRALSELLGTEIQVIGASRTDSGVHALCNVAVFDTDAGMPAEKFSYALNQRLPEDIRVRYSQEVAPDFHPRHCNSIKTYEYHIYNAEFAVPTKRLYSYFTYIPLDVERMDRAGHYLEGEHDFKSFCSVNTQAETTVRRILSVSVTETQNEGVAGLESAFTENLGEKAAGVWKSRKERDICIRVSGTGFLYNMVRIIAGTLIEVGQGKREPEDMQDILAACDRSKAGPTAPACGLTLTDYRFETKSRK